MNAPAIEVTNLVKTFHTRKEGDVTAVTGIDFHVNPGEVVAFLGPNGAGKTTTIDMLLGLTDPTGGSARIYGDLPRAAVQAGRVSAVLQSGGLLRDLSVHETVHVIASMFPSHANETDVMERAGIAHLAKRKISKCSGGEQQRVRFALALLPDPDLLILDEPTAGMDVNARDEFWERMQELARAGRTIVFATHYLAEASAFAQRILLMNQGAIIADGTVEAVRQVAGKRELVATVPDVAAAAAVLTPLGAQIVRTEASRIYVHAADSDRVALALLHDLHATDLEITLPSLDEAFQTLTKGPRQ